MRPSPAVHSHEVLRQIQPRRFHVVLRPGYVNNVEHFGRLHSSRAGARLAEHHHGSAMEICFLASGRQTFVVGKRSYELRGGDVFITFPGEKHGSGHAPMEKSTLYWVAVNPCLPKRNFLNYLDDEGEPLRARLSELPQRHFPGSVRMAPVLDKAFSAYFSDSPIGKLLFRNGITDFLLEIIDCAQHGPRRSDPAGPVGRVLDYIEAHLGEPLTIDHLSNVSGLSLSRFKQRFHVETGMPPGEYLLRRRIERAKLLLAHSRSRVTAAAIDCGFSSSQYFATVFRRFTGETPGDFARRCGRQGPER